MYQDIRSVVEVLPPRWILYNLPPQQTGLLWLCGQIDRKANWNHFSGSVECKFFLLDERYLQRPAFILVDQIRTYELQITETMKELFCLVLWSTTHSPSTICDQLHIHLQPSVINYTFTFNHPWSTTHSPSTIRDQLHIPLQPSVINYTFTFNHSWSTTHSPSTICDQLHIPLYPSVTPTHSHSM